MVLDQQFHSLLVILNKSKRYLNKPSSILKVIYVNSNIIMKAVDCIAIRILRLCIHNLAWLTTLYIILEDMIAYRKHQNNEPFHSDLTH